jgi:hypothetical protein
MKRLFLAIGVFCLFSCGDEDASRPKDVSTVDPNVTGPVDTVPLEMHLDNLNDTVALDSIGPTINPEDTNYSR